MTTYVARAVGPKKRSGVMLTAGMLIATGTAVGPLLGAILEAIVRAADLDSKLLSSGTVRDTEAMAPGVRGVPDVPLVCLWCASGVLLVCR